MTEKTPATLDRLWDDIPTGNAPIGDLLAAGHAARRRKRRTVLAGVVAATVLVLGGGALAMQAAPGRNGENRVADGSPVRDLTVQVTDMSQRVSSLFGGNLSRAAAIWNPDDQTIVYISRYGYSSSCPPEGTATMSKAGTVALDLKEYAGDGICTADAKPVAARIGGLTDPPPTISVTEHETTSTVPVESPSDYPPPGRDANQSLKVGETGELDLYLHCGLQYALIDGETWETDPRGNGSAPRGWPELLTGTATRTAEDTVVFTSPGVVDRLVFHPGTLPADWVCY